MGSILYIEELTIYRILVIILVITPLDHDYYYHFARL